MIQIGFLSVRLTFYLLFYKTPAILVEPRNIQYSGSVCVMSAFICEMIKYTTDYSRGWSGYSLGIPVSGLAGLRSRFFVRLLEMAKKGSP